MKIFITCLIIMSIISGFMFTLIFTYNLLELWRKKQLSKKSIHLNISQISNKLNYNSSFYWLMRNGISIFNKPCNFLLSKFKFINNYIRILNYELSNENTQSTSTTIFSTITGISLLICLICSVIFKSLIAGIAITMCCNVVVPLILKSKIEKKNKNSRELVPETLRSMNTCIKSGYTILQTFEQISSESSGIIKKIFLKCTHILKTGGTIQESLEPLKNSKENPELSFVAVALEIQHQTGGSMNHVIESAKDMAESKIKLFQMMRIQTAQAKLSSRIVIIMPFALIALFSIISPNFLQPFFSSLIGIVFFTIACIMQIAGIIIVRKTLNFSEE